MALDVITCEVELRTTNKSPLSSLSVHTSEYVMVAFTVRWLLHALLICNSKKILD